MNEVAIRALQLNAVGSASQRERPRGPFAGAPVAPLAAGVLAHSRWLLEQPNPGPFADWEGRNG